MPHKNVELRRITQRKYRALNPNKWKEVSRLSHEQRTLKKLGITTSDYKKVLQFQQNKCAICYKHVTELCKFGLQKDHDHRTGKFRGLLCTNCNTKLGWYEMFKGRVDWYLSVPPFASI